MTTIDKAAMEIVLTEHEIIVMTASVGPNGSWYTSVRCRCGHTSSPLNRAGHLSKALLEKLDMWLLSDT